MSTPLVTYEDALDVIETLAYLSPCQTATNIRALVVDLVEKITIEPSQQAPGFLYAGMIEVDKIYSLKT